MWKELTISSKGQVTLPKEMREELGLKPGDSVVLTVLDNKFIAVPKSIDFNDLAGFLGEPPAGRATLDELDDAVLKAGGANAMSAPNSQRDKAA